MVIFAESLFNAFATAAFFKFVVFSIFEMRYLLAIWKASRPLNNGEGWETMRRELSVLYSRFCKYYFPNFFQFQLIFVLPYGVKYVTVLYITSDFAIWRGNIHFPSSFNS